MARWVEQLANFQYKIVDRPGKLHNNADGLSRLPAYLRDGPCLGLQATQGDVSGVEAKVCVVQGNPSLGGPVEEGETDELSQAQMADELRRIIGYKKTKSLPIKARRFRSEKVCFCLGPT